MWLLRTLRVFAILVPFIPARIGYLICRVVGIQFYIVNIRARRNVLANLLHVTPGQSWLRRQWTAARVCITVVTNYYDLLRLRSVDRHRLYDYVDIEGLQHVATALAQGRGVIIVSAHLGNFGVMAKLPATLGHRTALVAEHVHPPELYQYMTRLRSAMGIEVIPPGHTAIRTIIDLLQDNGLLLLAGDRDVTRRGQVVRFFGDEATLPIGPVALAMKTGAALVPASTLRTSSQHSRVVIEPPLELIGTGDRGADLNANLQLLASRLEHMIAQDPGQWAVLQRVWPPTSTYRRSEGLGSADESIDRNNWS